MPGAPVYRVSELRDIEHRAHDQALMERAGLAAAESARDMIGDRGGPIWVLAGPGNNGGDAFVMARHLKSWFHDVTVIASPFGDRHPPDAAAALREWQRAGGTLERQWPALSGARQRPGLIVDGLFGIGLSRSVQGPAAEWIVRANESATPILALDIPSGLDAETGTAYPPTIRATVTASFIGLKPGLLTADGPDCCGRIEIHSLGLASTLLADAKGVRVDWISCIESLPGVLRRSARNVHKGSFGTVAIVGGAEGMVGAAILAGRAALFSGAGKVIVGMLSPSAPAVDLQQPELMLRPADSVVAAVPDACVVGPGLGTSPQARSVLERALALHAPLVVDADALNLIASEAALQQALRSRASNTLLTPHPAEAARLLRTSTPSVQSARLDRALQLAAQFNAAVVLKGSGSVLAFPDGRWAINASGNAALSSGGSGDVLAGVLGALLAQGIAPRTALEFGVCVHGAAADALVSEGTGPLGVTASELAPAVRRLINAAACDAAEADEAALG